MARAPVPQACPSFAVCFVSLDHHGSLAALCTRCVMDCGNACTSLSCTFQPLGRMRIHVKESADPSDGSFVGRDGGRRFTHCARIVRPPCKVCMPLQSPRPLAVLQRHSVADSGL